MVIAANMSWFWTLFWAVDSYSPNLKRMIYLKDLKIHRLYKNPWSSTLKGIPRFLHCIQLFHPSKSSWESNLHLIQAQNLQVNKILDSSPSTPSLRKKKKWGFTSSSLRRLPLPWGFFTTFNSKIPHLLALSLISPVNLCIRLVSDHQRAKESLWLGTHSHKFSDYFKESCNFYGAIVTLELCFHIVLRVELYIHTLMAAWFYKVLSFLIFYQFQSNLLSETPAVSFQTLLVYNFRVFNLLGLCLI